MPDNAAPDKPSVTCCKAIEVSLDALVSTNEDGLITLWNPAAEKMFGYTQEEALGMPVINLMPEEYRERHKAAFKRFLETGTTTVIGKVIEIEGLRKDGSRFSTEMSLGAEKIDGRWIFTAVMRDISKCMALASDLEKEKATLQTYFDIAGVMFVVIGADQKVMLLNRKTCDVLECEIGGIIGQNWFDTFIPERIREETRNVFLEIMRGNLEPYEYHENPVVTRNGKERIIAWHNTFLKDSSGKIRSTLGSGEDITERRKAEEALIQSENRIRSILGLIPDLIFRLSKDGVVIDFHSTNEDKLIVPANELRGKKIHDFLPPQLIEMAMLAIEQALKTGQVQICEYQIEVKGKLQHEESRLIALGKDEVLIMIRDITERKNMEEALKNEHDRLIRILDTMQDGVCIFSGDYEIEYINPVIFKEFGPVEGRKCYEYFHDRKDVCPWCPNKEVFAGKTVHWEWYSFKNQKTYDLIDSPLINPDGQVVKLEIFRDISERKKIEEALRESEEKYSTLVEKSNDGIVILQDNVIKFANSTVGEIVGIPVKEAIGKPFINFVSPEYRDLVSERYKKRTAGEEVPNKYEIGLLSENGEKIHCEVNSSLIEYKGKTAIMAIVRDITERKRMEDALHGERNTLLNIMNTMADGICIVSHEYDIEYINFVLEKEFGPINGRKCYKYFHDRDDVCKFCPNEDVFAGKTVRWEQYSIKNNRTYDLVAMPLKNLDGTTSKLGLYRDITDRKEMEETVKQLWRQNEMILNSAGEGIYGVDLEGRVTFINASSVKMLGYELDELIGKCMHDVSHHSKPDGSPHPAEECPIYAAYKDGTVHRVDNEVFWRKDGTSFPVEYISTPILENGRIVGAVVSFTDITERKKMEDELKEYSINLEQMVKERTKQLEEAKFIAETASRAKTEFIANMSHELRTPLNHVIGFSQILKDKIAGELNKQQHEFVDTIHSAGKLLLRYIETMLDMSDIEYGRLELDLGVVIVKNVLEECVAMFSDVAKNHKLNMSIEVDPPDIVIEADERRLKQILFNLLSNAMKFTSDGGSVSVRARRVNSSEIGVGSDEKSPLTPLLLRGEFPPLEKGGEGGFIEITVEDTGIGIKPEDIPGLFTMMKQLEVPYTKRYAGTGLGLALIKKLVELHNGRVWVESEFGKGSKFSFVIPVKQ